MEAEATTVTARRGPEKAQVIGWRSEALVRAGYSSFAADVIAAHTDIDLHRAVELVRNGCPHDLALKILL